MRELWAALPFAAYEQLWLTYNALQRTARIVLMPSFESMRTSFLTRAVADLGSRWAVFAPGIRVVDFLEKVLWV
jgi:hypothetical protein